MTKEYRKEVPVTRLLPFSEIPIMGVMKTTESAAPKVNLLSNSEYSLMLTQSGGGYSRWKGNDITRWRADTTCDPWGSFCYIKDVESGKFWSSTYQPTGTKGDKFNVHFKADKVEFSRRDEQIETTTNIAVSPQDNVEIRLVTIANLSKKTRTLELTSYQELALAPHKADRSHPCFNKFFIQTEAQEHLSGILAFRRMRSKDDQPLWAGHVTASSDSENRQFQYETDRNLFVGRGHTLASPIAMNNDLTNSSGYVLDPIFSLRRKITLAPGQRAEVSFVTAMSDNRETVIQLLDKYRDLQASKIAFEIAWTHAQLELRHLRIDQEEAQLFQKLASRIIYPHSQLRLTAERLRKNLLGQSRLWSYSISGDLPIIAVTISDAQELDLVKQVLTAHTFWRLRGLIVDCVILNEESYSYEQPLFSQINRLIHAQASAHGIEIGRPGGIYLLNMEQMPSEDVTLILSVARAHIVAARGYLRQHLVSPLAPITFSP
jgi:cellobiose phosphorylase